MCATMLEMARADPRVVSGAVVGGLAHGEGDRWSDLTGYGRGFDDLPPEVLDRFDDALVRSLERDELLRALESAVAALLRESAEAGDIAAKVEAQLRDLASA